MARTDEDQKNSLKAAEYAINKTLAHCKAVKLGPRKALKRIVEALSATDTKASYDKDRGKWVYSAPMIDWAARAKAVDQAIMVLDLKPADKSKVEHSFGDDVPEVLKALVKDVAEYVHQE